MPSQVRNQLPTPPAQSVFNVCTSIINIILLQILLTATLQFVLARMSLHVINFLFILLGLSDMTHSYTCVSHSKWTGHTTHMNELCHTHERVMVRVWMMKHKHIRWTACVKKYLQAYIHTCCSSVNFHIHKNPLKKIYNEAILITQLTRTKETNKIDLHTLKRDPWRSNHYRLCLWKRPIKETYVCKNETYDEAILVSNEYEQNKRNLWTRHMWENKDL